MAVLHSAFSWHTSAVNTVKTTQLKQPLSGYSSFRFHQTGEYYEENSQTYYHPSFPLTLPLAYKELQQTLSSLFLIIKPDDEKLLNRIIASRLTISALASRQLSVLALCF